MNWVVDVILNDALWTFFVVVCVIVILTAFLFIVVKQQQGIHKASIEHDLLGKGWQAIQITVLSHGRINLYQVKGINPDGQVETRECILIYNKTFWQDSETISS